MSRRLPMILAAMLGAAALPTAAWAQRGGRIGGLYAGQTSQSPIVKTYLQAPPHPGGRVEVAGNNSLRVTSFGFDYVATCPSGKAYSGRADYQGRSISVGRRSRWSTTYRYRPSDIYGAFTGVAVLSVAGRFVTARRAQATFAVTLTLRDADSGEVIDRCRTGTVTWAGTRR